MAVYNGEKYITTKELAEAAGMTMGSIVNYIKRGDITFTLVERKLVDDIGRSGSAKVRLFRPGDAEKFVASHQSKLPNVEDLDPAEWITVDKASEMSGYSRKAFYSAKLDTIAARDSHGIRQMINIESYERYVSTRKRRPKDSKRLCAATSNPSEEKGWERRFANAIIFEAVKDLSNAYKKEDRDMIHDCEIFFKSQWFWELSPDVDGIVLIEKIRKWVCYEV